MNQVGYLLSTHQGISGTPGVFYDYIIGWNGVFIRARNPLLEATVCVAPAEIRGLEPLDESLVLQHGRLPSYIYDLAVGALASTPWEERYVAVTCDDQGYHLAFPEQTGRAAGVKYERTPHTVLDIHSHSFFSAYFSETDTRDEQGLRMSMVVGELDRLIPDVRLRVCAYGYFRLLEIEDVFDV